MPAHPAVSGGVWKNLERKTIRKHTNTPGTDEQTTQQSVSRRTIYLLEESKTKFKEDKKKNQFKSADQGQPRKAASSSEKWLETSLGFIINNNWWGHSMSGRSFGGKEKNDQADEANVLSVAARWILSTG